jgi:hypothetical protein
MAYFLERDILEHEFPVDKLFSGRRAFIFPLNKIREQPHSQLRFDKISSVLHVRVAKEVDFALLITGPILSNSRHVLQGRW